VWSISIHRVKKTGLYGIKVKKRRELATIKGTEKMAMVTVLTSFAIMDGEICAYILHNRLGQCQGDWSRIRQDWLTHQRGNYAPERATTQIEMRTATNHLNWTTLWEELRSEITDVRNRSQSWWNLRSKCRTIESSITITHTHTHPFNDHLSRTTRVSQYQKGKTNLDNYHPEAK